jgi:hypothetical protein
MARRSILPSLLVSLSVFLCPAVSGAADVNFYSMHEQWVKNNKEPKTDKKEALDQGFASAANDRAMSIQDLGAQPAPPSLRSTLQQALLGPLEIELGQTVLVEQIGGLIKFVPSDEGIVTLENIDAETLRMIGTTVGSTYVHIWNSQGRNTVSVRVTPTKLVASRTQMRQREAIEKNRPFRFHYGHGRTATYNGVKFRDMPRNSLDFYQNFATEGDTPYGTLHGHVQTQKNERKMELSDAQVALYDGEIGRFDNFNAKIGDSRVEPGMLVFPAARIRGGLVEHWSEDKKLEWGTFYGRENTSLFGTIAPRPGTETTIDSFLSGGVVEYQRSDAHKLQAGYFEGYGQSRPDELNRRGADVKSELALGPHTVMANETGFDDARFAQKHSFTTKFEKLRVKNEFRDISKKFFTLTGAPPQQGEVGYVMDLSANPNEYWAFTGTFDVFRDRLIPNPVNPDRANTHLDLALNYTPCPEVGYGFTFQDYDDTGRLGPSRLRNIGLQYNERFDVWGHKATIFTRYNHRANHFLTSPLSDFRQDQIVAGVYTGLLWGINFSAQREWSYLEDVELGVTSYPAATTFTFDTNRQLWDTPFFIEARLRLRDEEETESRNSFMAGEDSAEIGGGLFYREYEDLELFVTGTLTQYVPENQGITEPRVEAQFFTGMRASFDTGFRWAAAGDFEGQVFKDIDGDGVRQENEPGMPGMVVVASDGKEAVTDEEGMYRIKGVTGKKVSLLLESSKIPYGFAPSNAASQDFEIKQGKSQRADFGLVPRSDVTGHVFNDVNQDGKMGAGEPPVPNVLLNLETGKGARSNSSGVYTFPNVVAGDHSIALAVARLPEGYLPLTQPSKSFTLFEGVRYELNFPLRAQRAVTGRVFVDTDKNGILDEGEQKLAGVTVTLAGQTVVTDSGGWYLFDDVLPGSHELKVERAEPLKIEMGAEPKTLSGMDIPVVS